MSRRTDTAPLNGDVEYTITLFFAGDFKQRVFQTPFRGKPTLAAVPLGWSPVPFAAMRADADRLDYSTSSLG